ncbi:ABC transporter permease [Chloroflexota bacterium]
MSPLESILVALRGLAAHRLRSSLTMLGLIVGVGAVVVLMSLGEGVQAQITTQLSSLGTNTLNVVPGRTMHAGMQGAMGSAQSLTLEDARAIESSPATSSVAAVVPRILTFAEVAAKDESLIPMVVGSTPGYLEILNYKLAEGSLLTQYHVNMGARVVVVGNSVAETLFEGVSPIGQLVKINRIKYRVIGVTEKKGAMFMMDMDDFVLMPITTQLSKLSSQLTSGGKHSVSSIYIKAASEEDIDAAKEQVSKLLRKRHRLAPDEEDDFVISSMEDLLSTIGQVTGILTMFLAAIAGISLLVAGIGIMNIMLVSVTERTREIGIRKAVGAKRRDILAQFLIESAVLSLSGGGIGLLIGWGISRGISAIDLGGQTIQAVVSLDIVLLAFSVAVAIGVFFGLYPASRAARLNPIDALRYE